MSHTSSAEDSNAQEKGERLAQLLDRECSWFDEKECMDLIANGADPNFIDQYDRTVLILAVIRYNANIVNALLESGADVNAKNHDQETALFCIGMAPEEMSDILIHHGADIETRNGNGQTPLAHITEQRLTDSVKALIRHGAKINVRDNQEQTPLMYTARAWGEINICHLLLEHGAQTDLRDKDGKTAQDIAIFKEREDIFARIEESKFRAADAKGTPRKRRIHRKTSITP
ncbi:MAG: ankyrin repeat domain-containing protein [Alphaproteobacteria bacterium]|nr:ankyrin repeat domain-containing protein [Alphaproteobacteria bacterium]